MTHYYSDVTTKLMSLCTYVGTKLNLGDDNHAPDKKGWVFHFSNFNVSVFKDVDTDKVYYYSEIVDNVDPATTKLKFDMVDGKPIITIGPVFSSPDPDGTAPEAASGVSALPSA